MSLGYLKHRDAALHPAYITHCSSSEAARLLRRIQQIHPRRRICLGVCGGQCWHRVSLGSCRVRRLELDRVGIVAGLVHTELGGPNVAH
jgi:hypothetical protein